MPSIRARIGGLVPDVLRRNAVPIGLLTYAVVVYGAVGGLAYFAMGYPVDQAALQAVEEDPAVQVDTTPDGDWVLRDPDPETEAAGVVFYPGARVQPQSYVPVLASLVREGNATVVIPDMPLNMAILDAGAAGPTIDAYPQVDRWYVGGHSLGGAMACRYASGNADRLEGVVLFGAYCASDVSETDLDVLVVSGTRDGVIDRASLRNNRKNLPPDAAEVSVEGINHTYFGSYTGQSGDGVATVSRAEAHRRLGVVVVSFLRDRSLPETEWIAVQRPGNRTTTGRWQSPGSVTRSAASGATASPRPGERGGRATPASPVA